MITERQKLLARTSIVVDAIVLFFAFLCALYLRTYLPKIVPAKFYLLYHIFNVRDAVLSVIIQPEMLWSLYGKWTVYFIVLWLLLLAAFGMYRPIRLRRILEILLVISKTALASFLILGSLIYIFSFDIVSRVFFTTLILVSSVFIGLEKVAIILLLRYIHRRGVNLKNILIVGANRRTEDFLKLVRQHREWGFVVMGILDTAQAKVGTDFHGIRIIGMPDDLAQILDHYVVDDVIFIVPRKSIDFIEKAIITCETRGIRATVVMDLFNLNFARATVSSFGSFPLLSFETKPIKEWELTAKRCLDFSIALLALIVLFIPGLVVAFLIKSTSKGNVLFKQVRVGLNGRKFLLYKFRSMKKGAHAKIKQLQSQNEMDGPVFKIKNDPRITPLGRFLRKSSIDELPQLVNVLKGEMSLVGPRPPLRSEVKKYEPWQRRRLSMRPGLTCLWQVNGRNKIDFEEWMKLDLQYIDNWSLWLDVKILFQTVAVVLSTKGAS